MKSFAFLQLKNSQQKLPNTLELLSNNLRRILLGQGMMLLPLAISITKLVKLSIDNLVKDLEGLPEEDAVEHLKELYKEALF